MFNKKSPSQVQSELESLKEILEHISSPATLKATIKTLDEKLKSLIASEEKLHKTTEKHEAQHAALDKAQKAFEAKDKAQSELSTQNSQEKERLIQMSIALSRKEKELADREVTFTDAQNTFHAEQSEITKALNSQSKDASDKMAKADELIKEYTEKLEKLKSIAG